MMRHYCTYFDMAYMDRGLALLSSMQTYCAPFHLWILALDNGTYHALSQLAMPDITVISMRQFETPQLQAACATRTWQEYIWTLTGNLMIYVAFRAEAESLNYIDADCYFFDNPESMFDEIGAANIAITPHRYPPRVYNKFIGNGAYNVGLVYARLNLPGMACISEWAQQTIEWCFYRQEPGRFADQKYLDEWPAKYEAHTIQHLGANLAPWNQEQYNYEMRDGKVYVEHYPLIWYHFHQRLTPAWPIVPFVQDHIYMPYAAVLGQLQG